MGFVWKEELTKGQGLQHETLITSQTLRDRAKGHQQVLLPL